MMGLLVTSRAQIEHEVPTPAPRAHAGVGLSSNVFEVRGRLRLADHVLEQTSLVERRGLDVIVLQRERVSSRDQATS